MPSYQDIETRLNAAERKLEFVLKAFQVVDQTNPFARPRTLLDEYYRIQGEGPSVVVTDAEIVDAPAESAPEGN